MATSTNPSRAEAEVRATIESWASALRAKDVEGAFAHRAPDLVQFAFAPPLQNAGATALDRKFFATWFASFQGEIGYEIRDLHVTAGEEVAFSHSLNRLHGTTAEGKTTEMWFRETLCFRKVDGAWKIVHEHESVPFYMDSRKATTDLQP